MAHIRKNAGRLATTRHLPCHNSALGRIKGAQRTAVQGEFMLFSESFLDKTFVVNDSDARIRSDEDMMQFVLAIDGRFKTIPNGTKVRIVQVAVAEAGSRSTMVFARATSIDSSQVFGWTSTQNLRGKFINETVGVIRPKSGAGRFGPNAAWSDGIYLGQLELIAIVDSKFEIGRLALKTIEPYATIAAAAASDGVQLTLNSGFRSYSDQTYLHDGYVRGLPGFHTAAKPGYSKHQNGIAFDLSVPGGNGNPTYEWLKRNAPKFGFVRTVNREPWHWEWDEPKAQAALVAGTFKTGDVTA